MKGIYVYCIAKSRKRPSVVRSPAGLPGATRPEVVGAGAGVWLVLAEVPLAFDLREQGTLQLFRTEKYVEASKADQEVLAEYDSPYEVLTRDECIAVEPGLVATGLTGAWVNTVRGLIFLVSIIFYLYVDEPQRRAAFFARLRGAKDHG